MTHWSHENFGQKTSAARKSTAFHLMVRATETSASHEISLFSEGDWEDVLKRLIGFVLVAGMPEEGLKEALVSLKEIYEFNLENIRYQIPEPSVIRTGTGTVVSISGSPDLVIQEE